MLAALLLACLGTLFIFRLPVPPPRTACLQEVLLEEGAGGPSYRVDFAVAAEFPFQLVGRSVELVFEANGPLVILKPGSSHAL